MIYIAVFLGLLYFLLLAWFIRGWTKIPAFISNNDSIQKDGLVYSIIIAARNEEENIEQCLRSILHQSISKENFEVIVVDDHSEDQTSQIVEKIQSENQEYLIQLFQAPDARDTEFVAYKKNAINCGIEQASGEWIITTDADCSSHKEWLNTLSNFIYEKGPYLVAGPVAFSHKNSFESAQALEFMSLIGIGAASINNKAPNMCNGANLAYRKDIFYKVNGFLGVNTIASGDDEFLMHKIFQHYPEKVYFLKSPEAIVRTSPAKSIKEFIQQRKRWVSKGSYYKHWSILVVIYFVFFFHLAILLSLGGAAFYPVAWDLYLILMGFKVIPEFLFLLPITKFFTKRRLLIYYLPAAILYPFYVVFIAIFGNTGNYTWKERRVH